MPTGHADFISLKLRLIETMKKHYSAEAILNYRHDLAVPYHRTRTKKFIGIRLGFSKYPSDPYPEWEPKFSGVYNHVRRMLDSRDGVSIETVERAVAKSLRWNVRDVKKFLESRFRLYGPRVTWRRYAYEVANGVLRVLSKNPPVRSRFTPDQVSWNESHAPRNLDKVYRQCQVVLGKYWYGYTDDSGAYVVEFGTVLHQASPKCADCYDTPRHREYFRSYDKISRQFRNVYVPGLRCDSVLLSPAVIKS